MWLHFASWQVISSQQHKEAAFHAAANHFIVLE
jgi:hypothetical protein